MDTQDTSENQAHPKTDARRRLRGFAIHMAVYAVVMTIAVAVNFILMPGEWWFPFPMVIWGAPLALHAAYAMGLIKPYRVLNEE